MDETETLRSNILFILLNVLLDGQVSLMSRNTYRTIGAWTPWNKSRGRNGISAACAYFHWIVMRAPRLPR